MLIYSGVLIPAIMKVFAVFALLAVLSGKFKKKKLKFKEFIKLFEYLLNM